jgi:hypothetical protein
MATKDEREASKAEERVHEAMNAPGEGGDLVVEPAVDPRDLDRLAAAPHNLADQEGDDERDTGAEVLVDPRRDGGDLRK